MQINLLIILIITIILLSIGLVRLLKYRKTICARIEFTATYFSDLQKLLRTKNKEEFASLYFSLTHDVNKMQRELEHDGIVSQYSPPFLNIIYKNYPILINTLPTIPQYFENRKNDQINTSEIRLLMDSIIRHLGTLDEYENSAASDLKNPLMWLREGIQSTIFLPISLLNWAGLISSQTVDNWRDSIIVKVATGIVALSAFLASIVQIILGWDEITNLFER